MSETTAIDPQSETVLTNEKIGVVSQDIGGLVMYQEAEHKSQPVLTEKHNQIQYFESRAAQLTVDLNLTDFDAAKKYFYGVEDEVIEGALLDTELMKDGMRIAHRMSADSFDKFLIDGRLKSYKETGYSGGSAKPVASGDPYEDVRDRYENAYGLREDGEPELIHGFIETLATVSERGIATSYGPVELILKSEVMDRSVYTFGDSGQTQEAPQNKESALVYEHIRNRNGQRYGTTSGKNRYTEAIVLGGVKVEDVEAVVVTMGGRQVGQRASEKSGPKTLEEVVVFIEQVMENMPGAKIGIQIPAETVFYTQKIIKLAEDYPDVNFMATVGLGDNSTPSPFRTLGAPDKSEIVGAKFAALSNVRDRQEFQHAFDRRNLLQAKLEERWKNAGNTTHPPKNISYHIKNIRY